MENPEVPENLGPMMSALAEGQRRFVVALLDNADDNYTRAAGDAYPNQNIGSLRVTGYRLAHDPRVQDAIREIALARMGAAAIMATSTLVQIAKGGGQISTKDQLRAVEMLLNRVGLHATTEHKVQVERKTDEKTMIHEIKLMASRMGLDPQLLLGQAGIIDAEFEVVEKVLSIDEWTAE